MPIPAVAENKIAEATTMLSSAFTMPYISPMIVPPPYRYRDTRALNVLFRTDPDILSKIVPAPLVPDPARPAVFYIGHFQFVDYDLPYNEAGLLAPVTYNGEPGFFTVVLYLDKTNPIVGGREIYGWPKKDAEEVLFAEKDGKVTAGVTRYGNKIISATFEPAKTEFARERPKMPLYFLKMIPSIEQGAPPDVLKLNSMFMDPDVITGGNVGAATLKFGESPYDAFLGEIPIKEVLYSEVIVHEFTLGFGKTVFNYLAKH